MSQAAESPCGCVELESPSTGTCYCRLTDLMQVVGRKYALSLIALMGNHDRLRFSEIKERLKGISSSTLSTRLAELEQLGLVSRQMYPEVPPRVEYTLTDEGEALRRMLKPFLDRVPPS